MNAQGRRKFSIPPFASSNFAIFFLTRVLAHPRHFVPYFTIFPGP